MKNGDRTRSITYWLLSEDVENVELELLGLNLDMVPPQRNMNRKSNTHGNIDAMEAPRETKLESK